MSHSAVVSSFPFFRIDPESSTNESRLQSFINWASPDGSAGISNIHSPGYDASLPYFEYSKDFLPTAHLTTRSWFVRQEHLNDKKIFSKARNGNDPVILNANALISDGPFLRFAKAYINVVTFYKGIRTHPKATVTALICVEKALRILFEGTSDPSRSSALVFDRALRLLTECKNLGDGKKYDAAQEMKVLAGMLHGGHHTKTFRFGENGFNLISGARFQFVSMLKAKRGRPKGSVFDDLLPIESNHCLTSEDVAALGLAYRRACSPTDGHRAGAFIAALACLPLTTVPMRPSDLSGLRRDALYEEPDVADKRSRIRIFRPKIDTFQELPVPKALSSLAHEFFQTALDYSEDAHLAFVFYLNRFQDQASITKLFIPERLRDIFDQPYLTLDEVEVALETRYDSPGGFANTICEPLTQYLFAVEPNDLYECTKAKCSVARISWIVQECSIYGIKFVVPHDVSPQRFIHATQALKMVTKSARAKELILSIFERNSFISEFRIRSSQLERLLLEDFKARQLPHWPYASKDKVVRLDESLAVWTAQSPNAQLKRGDQSSLWWKVGPVVPAVFSRWLGSVGNAPSSKPPILFKLLNIKKRDGSYPSVPIYATRKYHHTQALLAGASPPLLDVLAGRSSGWQSTHYDLRTPHEILTQSIETFDPDSDYPVMGPVAEMAPMDMTVVERRTFMFDNASPKHITEAGGCNTDWSLNPCEMFGDCMRCDKSDWMKGDLKRVTWVVETRDHALTMVQRGAVKMLANPLSQSIAKQVRQFEETIARCNRILDIEADASISPGTIVTFAAAATAMTTFQRDIHLRGLTRGREY